MMGSRASALGDGAGSPCGGRDESCAVSNSLRCRGAWRGDETKSQRGDVCSWAEVWGMDIEAGHCGTFVTSHFPIHLQRFKMKS